MEDIEVSLGYTAVSMTYIPPAIYEQVGGYTVKERKTAQEIYREKAEKKLLGKKATACPYKITKDNVIFKLQDGSYAFPIGLWPRMQKALSDSNITYKLQDNRDKALKPVPSYELITANLLPGQDIALATIATADGGIISCCTGWGKSMVMCMVCQMYPTLNIAIATSSTQVVRTIYDRLVKLFPKTEIGLCMEGTNTTQGKRIVVSTMASLDKVNPEKIQLVMVDECHSIGDNVGGATLAGFKFSRRFGFSATPLRNDGTDRVMEAILGPVVYEMSYNEAVDNKMVVPLKYVMLNCDSGPSFLKDDAVKLRKSGRPMDDSFKKRYDYWRNYGRNRIIAAAISRILQASPDQQVLVMVDTLEHAIMLHSILPSFTVAHYGAKSIDSIQKIITSLKLQKADPAAYYMSHKDLNDIRVAFAEGKIRRLISTTTLKQGVDFPALRIIVRAEGRLSGVDSIQIPGRVSRICEGKDTGYVIDVFDNQDTWARKRSKERETLYINEGWEKTTLQEMIDELRCSSAVGSE